MPAGFYVRGESGVTQIDENYKNLVMVGTLNVDTSETWVAGGAGLQVTAEFTVAGQEPVIAFRGRNGGNKGMLIYRRKISEGVFGFRLGTISHSNVGFRVYIFDYPRMGDGTNVGLEVFDGQGAKTYDSDWPVMRVVDMFAVTNNEDFSPVVRYYDSGKLYAALMSTGAYTARGAIIFVGSVYEYVDMGEGFYVSIDSNQVTSANNLVYQIIYPAGQTPSLYQIDNNVNVLILDVTGY